MRSFLLTLLGTLAAAVAFTATIPADATTVDWELPSLSMPGAICEKGR